MIIDYNPKQYQVYKSRLSWGNYSVCPFCVLPTMQVAIAKSGNSVYAKCRSCSFQLLRVKPSNIYYLLGVGSSLTTPNGASDEVEFEFHTKRLYWGQNHNQWVEDRFQSGDFYWNTVKNGKNSLTELWYQDSRYNAFCYSCGLYGASFRKDKNGKSYLSHAKDCGANLFCHSETSQVCSLGLSMRFENLDNVEVWHHQREIGKQVWISWNKPLNLNSGTERVVSPSEQILINTSRSDSVG